MPNIATINGIDEDDIATHNGTTASTILSKKGCTWEHLTNFGGGNQSAADLKTFFDTNFINSFAVNSPTAGGTLTLNGQNCGSYDYVLKRSDITLSSVTSSEWFTTTKDTRSAIIGVVGNLTLNAGVFLRPPDRKLFMAIYVDGNLTINAGGAGDQAGDVVGFNTLGLTTQGRDGRLSIVSIGQTSELVLNNVQGDFVVGSAKTVMYINTANAVTVLNSGHGGDVQISSINEVACKDGLHIKVNHQNHGMYWTNNRVSISGAISDIKPT